MKRAGFTVIELLIVAAFLITAGIVLFLQIQRVDIENSNNQQKIAINAIYHSLEKSFYKENQHYPENIKDDTLKTMDSELLVDPFGVKIGEPGSSYRYEPKNCIDGKCASYTLRAELEKEAQYVKESLQDS